MNNKGVYDTSILPDNIFTLKSEEFFRVIRSLVGEIVCNILQIQLIDSAENFLNTIDIFEIFKYDSEEIDEIKVKSCFKMRNGDYVIRAGILNNMTYLKAILRKKFEQHYSFTNNVQKERYYELIDQNSMLQALIDWCSLNRLTNNDNNEKQLFISSFIDTIAKNINKSKQSYRYNGCVKDFALVLYTLGGKQCYEFVRINIIGALPNLTTINKLISNTDFILTECQFCFGPLKQYADTLNVRFGFCAEDCTSVIKKVEYNVITTSFVGFVAKLSNGVPICNYYQTDSFEQLQFWFDNIEKAPLLSIHVSAFTTAQ